MSTYKKIAIRGIGLLLVVGFIGLIAIQFLPLRPRTNPAVVSEPQWDSAQTRQLMERACFDCHSNETKWPAYAYVAPVSWLIVGEVNEGRHKLNFSRWNAGENEEGAEESVEQIHKGEMPPRQYLLLHPEARLNDTEVKQLVAGLQATFGSGGEGEYGEGDEAHEHEEDEEHEDEEHEAEERD